MQKQIEDEKQRIKDLRMLLDGDDDYKAPVVRLRTSLEQWLRRPSATLEGRLPKENLPRKGNSFGLSAYMMLFEDKNNKTGGYTGVTDETVPGIFPNQKIPLEELLYNKTLASNPLMRPCQDEMIRYFHLPRNNMEWIEVNIQASILLVNTNFAAQEAIARYCNDERPDYDGLFQQPSEPSKAYMILRPGFWRGQQLGGTGAAIYARQMRPLCDIISTGQLLPRPPDPASINI
jgi:hypothetical protein